MYRSQGIKSFQPESPELALIDAMTTEQMNVGSQKILLWKFNKEDTLSDMDDLDNIYGESSKPVYTGPFEIIGKTELNPIIIELIRMGSSQIEELELMVNIADTMNRMENELPKAGDVIRISYIEKYALNQGDTPVFRNVFYTLSNPVPIDIFRGKYVNLHIYCEQTNMEILPQEIKDYMNTL